MERFLRATAADSVHPELHDLTGVVRFDVVEPERTSQFFLHLDRGRLRVEAGAEGRVDAVMRADEAVLDGMAAGTVNPIAALLRGVLTVEGDLGLVTAVTRLLPGPPRSGAGRAGTPATPGRS